MERKVFADLKVKCKTKRQMLAFNELVKSFADEPAWIVYNDEGELKYGEARELPNDLDVKFSGTEQECKDYIAEQNKE